MKLTTKNRKKFRIKNKIKKTSGEDRFRLSVSRSLKNITAQIIDDKNNKTLVSASSVEKDIKKSKALVIGGGAIGLLCGLILSNVKKCDDITIVDPNNKRLKECSKYLNAMPVSPESKNIIESNFDIVFDTVGLEATRLQAIKSIKPGGTIIHIGLTQSGGNFDFRKATLQEITFIGTYCYTNEDFKKTLKLTG